MHAVAQVEVVHTGCHVCQQGQDMRLQTHNRTGRARNGRAVRYCCCVMSCIVAYKRWSCFPTSAPAPTSVPATCWDPMQNYVFGRKTLGPSGLQRNANDKPQPQSNTGATRLLLITALQAWLHCEGPLDAPGWAAPFRRCAAFPPASRLATCRHHTARQHSNTPDTVSRSNIGVLLWAIQLNPVARFCMGYITLHDSTQQHTSHCQPITVCVVSYASSASCCSMSQREVDTGQSAGHCVLQ